MKKFFSSTLILLLILFSIPFTAYAMDNTENSKSTSIITIDDYDNEIHEKPGDDYNIEWFEGFEDGIPNTWENLDKDSDNYKWWLFNDEPTYEGYNYAHHGNFSIKSNSFLRYNSSELTPDNWLILPEQDLSVSKNYILTFDAECLSGTRNKDYLGIYISTDGGNNYNQIGEDFSQQPYWRRVSVDLSEYSGKKIKIAVVHHNSFNQSMVILDCFYLYSKDNGRQNTDNDNNTDNSDNEKPNGESNDNKSDSKTDTKEANKSDNNKSAKINNATETAGKKSPETGNYLYYGIIILTVGVILLFLALSKLKKLNIN